MALLARKARLTVSLADSHPAAGASDPGSAGLRRLTSHRLTVGTTDNRQSAGASVRLTVRRPPGSGPMIRLHSCRDSDSFPIRFLPDDRTSSRRASTCTGRRRRASSSSSRAARRARAVAAACAVVEGAPAPTDAERDRGSPTRNWPPAGGSAASCVLSAPAEVEIPVVTRSLAGKSFGGELSAGSRSSRPVVNVGTVTRAARPGRRLTGDLDARRDRGGGRSRRPLTGAAHGVGGPRGARCWRRHDVRCSGASCCGGRARPSHGPPEPVARRGAGAPRRRLRPRDRPRHDVAGCGAGVARRGPRAGVRLRAQPAGGATVPTSFRGSGTRRTSPDGGAHLTSGGSTGTRRRSSGDLAADGRLPAAATSSSPPSPATRR